MDDFNRRRRVRERAGTYLTPKETAKAMLDQILFKLAKAPWLVRQVTKFTGYVGTLLTPLLAKAQVVVNGETIDLFTAQQEVAIVSGVVTLLAIVGEVVLSFAAAAVSARAKAAADPDIEF